MKKCFGRIFLVLMISACALAQAVAQNRPRLAVHIGSFVQQGATTQVETPWEKFSPEGGGFAVLFPSRPKGSDETLDTNIGAVIHHQFSLETATGYFMVSYVDYPEAVTDSVVIKTLLDAGREGGLKATNGELRSEKDIKIGENLGREWVVSIPGGGIARARAYWVTRRLYQAVVMLPETKNVEVEKAREATMSKFLDSFVLIETGGPR